MAGVCVCVKHGSERLWSLKVCIGVWGCVYMCQKAGQHHVTSAGFGVESSHSNPGSITNRLLTLSKLLNSSKPQVSYPKMWI